MSEPFDERFWVDENGDKWTVVVDEEGRETPTLHEKLQDLIDHYEGGSLNDPDVMMSACHPSDPPVDETDLHDVWGYDANASDSDASSWLEATDE